MFENFQYNIFVRIIPPVINRIMFLLIPLMTWRSHRRVYNHMKQWQNLQDTLSDIQKSPFSLPFKNTIPYTTIAILIGTILILIPLKPYFDIEIAASSSILSYLFLGETVIFVALYWLTNCLFVALVARNIVTLINQSITSKNEDSLMKLVDFWVKLYDWNAEFPSTASITFLINVLNMIVTMVTCLYAFTFLIFVEEDKSASLAYFTCTIISFLILLIFCESSNLVLNQIGRLTHVCLLTTDTKEMNPRILKVILIFIQTIETKQPKIMMNGIMIISRSSLISISATIINFLIVLKQFNPLG
ncbi:uncharacterized protein LOC135843857 [Planococcus citri]|uniref:uncharacterized protein LOC135843857 n=1 Tax=Planococcus citri TaxID=170843 RepID=UPI0031F8AEA4